MTTETGGLTRDDVDAIAQRIFQRAASYQELLFGLAIERAVLQSPEIRKALAVSALVDQFFSSSNSIPVDRATITKAVVDAAIYAAMEKQP